MNIFVFFSSLNASAKYFFEKDPRRANKQILELTQCIATVLAERGISVPKKDGTPYKPTHVNHPVVRWLRESDANMGWAARYLRYLQMWYHGIHKKHHGCFSALPAINRHTSSDGWEVTPIHHGNNVPRTGDVYKDYRDYLDIKLAADAEKRAKV